MRRASAVSSQNATPVRVPLGAAVERRIDNEFREVYGSTPEARQAIIERMRSANPDSLRFTDPKDSAAVVRDLSKVRDSIKSLFDVTSGENPKVQSEIARSKQANCFGSTQLFLAVARAQGIDATPIHVERTAQNTDALHVASLVKLPDGKSATVDVLTQDAVSKPFDLATRYNSNGRALEVNPAEAGENYARIRVLNSGQFNAFVESQEVAPTDKGAAQKLAPLAAADPNNVWIQQAIGDAWSQTSFKSSGLAPGTPDGNALAAYQQALKLDPDHVSALRDSGRLYRNNGKPELAIQTYAREASVLENRVRAVLGKGASDATIAAAMSRDDLGSSIGWLADSLDRRAGVLASVGRSNEAQELKARVARLTSR